MHVYLLRHGIAEDAADGEPDQDRQLTTEGREKLSELLHRVAKSGVRPDAVLSSPYKRAMQTARLAAKILDAPDPIASDELVPHGTPGGLWNEIRAQDDAAHLLLAGHEPLFSQSVSYLLGTPTLAIEMKKGAMVAIEFSRVRSEPRGTLQWMLIPRLCL